MKNDEVVECQPQSGIVTVLDSVAIFTTILEPPAQPVAASFMDCLLSLLHPTALPSSVICRLITSLSVAPALQLLYRKGTLSTLNLHTPTTR